jgi:hypothetical protein
MGLGGVGSPRLICATAASLGAMNQILSKNFVLAVGKVTSYADVVQGTHRNSSDVADVVRQPLVNSRM